MKSPAFQFYPHDFLVGTADLTAEEVGGYIRLLCYQWAKGSLPNDDKKLMQLSGITDGLSLGNVSVKFRLCDDGLKRNDRLENVRLEQQEYRRKQSENGQKGGNPNFKPGNPNPYYKKDNPQDNPKINSSPSSSPSSITKDIKKEDRSSPKRKLTDLWCLKYRETFNTPYKFEGAKDGIAADSLLSLLLPSETLIDIAVRAWRKSDGFWCKQAASLSGFASKFNNIRSELGDLKATETKPSYDFGFLDKKQKTT